MSFTEASTVENLIRDLICDGVIHHTPVGGGLARNSGKLTILYKAGALWMLRAMLGCGTPNFNLRVRRLLDGRSWLTTALISWSFFMTGCSYLGYYKYEPAVRAPSIQSESVRFPGSYDGSLRTEGAMTRALAVAMNDFLPLGRSLTGDNLQVVRCLSRWETYDISILQAKDDLFFVQFSPILARCGLDDSTLMDAGAEYAVDGQGRILAVH